jgi:hypothetical protein
MRAVRFGTGSGRETRQTHVADFYKLVDRGMQTLVREPEIPLVLAGVDEDTSLYRSVSACRSLAGKTIHGNGKLRTNQAELIAEVYAIIHHDTVQHARKSLAEAKERSAPNRLLTALDTILPAAFEGRVNQLFVKEGGESLGIFERHGYRSWGTEDLLNLAMVQTVRHRGKAFVLPGDMLPDGELVAASVRF